MVPQGGTFSLRSRDAGWTDPRVAIRHRAPDPFEIEGGRFCRINRWQRVLGGHIAETRTILYVQVAEPAAYPPLIHSALIFAEAGWSVTILASPSFDKTLSFPKHKNIDMVSIGVRPDYIVTKRSYADYCLKSILLSRRLRPAVVYASDPIGALPGLLAAWAGKSHLVYHEHDSPEGHRRLNSVLRVARRRATRRAQSIVFPNLARAEIAAKELAFSPEQVRIVWNLPRRNELPALQKPPEGPLIVYYHGTIVPDRLPQAAVAAIARFNGRVRLRIAGYETLSGFGYLDELHARFRRPEAGGIIEYIGQIDRESLLTQAARAHVGLALCPMEGGDINMRNMTGASNKAFDYMAAGLPIIVSDLPDWRALFVDSGHALAVDPRSESSLAAAIGRFLENPALRMEMGTRNRARIATEWNYDQAFSAVMRALYEFD